MNLYLVRTGRGLTLMSEHGLAAECTDHYTGLRFPEGVELDPSDDLDRALAGLCCEHGQASEDAEREVAAVRGSLGEPSMCRARGCTDSAAAMRERMDGMARVVEGWR